MQSRATMKRTALVIGLAVLAPRAGHADQLGYGFGGGPVLASHGPLAGSFAPAVIAWFGLVGYHGPWQLDAAVLALDDFAGDRVRGAIGGTLGLRRYHVLADGMRNGVRWQVAAFGAAGWTVAALGPPHAPSEDDPRSLAPSTTVGPAGDATLTGPRLGAGLELALSQGRVHSRVAVALTDQELFGASAGGYLAAELALSLSFGR